MMGDDEEPVEIEYTVRISGGQVEHEQIREQIHELGGEIRDEEQVDEDFCDFYSPDVETENKRVVCPECRDDFPANEAALTMDQTNWDGGDNATAVIRRYVCSEECAMKITGMIEDG